MSLIKSLITPKSERKAGRSVLRKEDLAPMRTSLNFDGVVADENLSNQNPGEEHSLKRKLSVQNFIADVTTPKKPRLSERMASEKNMDYTPEKNRAKSEILSPAGVNTPPGLASAKRKRTMRKTGGNAPVGPPKRSAANMTVDAGALSSLEATVQSQRDEIVALHRKVADAEAARAAEVGALQAELRSAQSQKEEELGGFMGENRRLLTLKESLRERCEESEKRYQDAVAEHAEEITALRASKADLEGRIAGILQSSEMLAQQFTELQMERESAVRALKVQHNAEMHQVSERLTAAYGTLDEMNQHTAQLENLLEQQHERARQLEEAASSGEEKLKTLQSLMQHEVHLLQGNHEDMIQSVRRSKKCLESWSKQREDMDASSGHVAVANCESGGAEAQAHGILEKQIHNLQEVFEALQNEKEAVQTAVIRDMSGLRSKLKDMEEKYFFALSVAMKLAEAQGGNHRNVNVMDMYDEARSSAVPYHQWPNWISEKFHSAQLKENL